MGAWRQLTRGVHRLVDRTAPDREVADEVEHYLAQAAEAHEAAGLTPAEALRAARLELGGVTGVQEQVRGYGWENAVETLAADLRYAVRRLARAPGFTIVATLTLALGIGATTAIYSAVRPVLFEPLPYPEPGRLAAIWDVGDDGARVDATFGTFTELVARSRSFDALSVMKTWQPTLVGTAEPERLTGQRVSWAFFRVLGVPPMLGAAFQASDDRPDGGRSVILGYGLWRRRFAADSSIIGRTVRLDGDDHLVVGVMPPDFENLLAPDAELYAPLQYDMTQGRAWGHHLRLIGRVRPDANLETARRELTAIAGSPVAELPRASWAALEHGLTVTSLQHDLTRSVRPALLAMLGAVALVLVIACVNVTNLLLVRGAQRRGEFALRAALGAAQGRLRRQLLTESLLLAAVGGVTGMVVAVVGLRALVALAPPGLPRAGAIGVDGEVFAVGLGLTTLIGLVVGLLPARQASGGPHQDLQHASPRAGGAHRARGALVVAEVGLALVLLVSSGLLLRSLQRLFAEDSGIDAANLFTMQIQAAGHRLDDDSTTHRFFAEALEAVRRVPGVGAAALTSQLPLSGDNDLYGVHFDPAPMDDPGELRGSFRYAVTPGYLETMGIPLRQGRRFDARDRAGAPLVAIISESMARRRFQGADPLGARLRVGDGPLYTVVGVAGDVRQLSLDLSEAEAVYLPSDQWQFADRAMSLVVRRRGEVAELAPAIRRAVWSVDPEQAVVRAASMEELVAASAADRRFALTVFEVFAMAALALAAAGIYGVLAGSVAERTREIGVRAALGASRAAILAMVLRQGLALTAVGVVFGVVGAVLATQAIAALLYGVPRLDPITYLGVIALLVAVGTAACSLPAWRAARVDPATTLRAE